MVVLLEGSTFSTEALEVCQSDHWVLGHLLSRLLNFTRWQTLGRVLVVPNFFHLRMIIVFLRSI
jgi:hypothetical protein